MRDMNCLPRLAIVLSLALACGDTTNTSEGASSTGETPGTSTGEPGTTGEQTSAPTTGATTGETTSDATTGDPTTGGTTGEAAYCHGWDGAAGPAHLELHNGDVLLADGGVLNLECGGQGLYMFGLYPTFGGFLPTNDNVTFELTVDVPGHNTNPDGHFYSNVSVIYYVGCEDLIGGVFGVVPILPPDNDDPLTLGGLTADVEVRLHAGDEVVTVKFTATLAVDPNDPSFMFCGG